MVGKRARRFAFLMTVLSGVAIVLPSAVTLLAEDKPALKAVPATTTSKPATAPAAKTKEAKRAEEIALVMEFFHQTQPDVYEKARRLRETDPAKFESLIQPAIHTVYMLEEIRKTDQDYYNLKIEDYRLTFQAQTVAAQLHRPDLATGEREKILVDLNSLVSRQFDVGQQIRQKEIAAIEDKIKKLQSQLEERNNTKDKIIKRRLEELIK